MAQDGEDLALGEMGGDNPKNAPTPLLAALAERLELHPRPETTSTRISRFVEQHGMARAEKTLILDASPAP
jgi:hypothetical protein